MIWKAKGTPANRLVFQLRRSDVSTKDKEYFLLPTPNHTDWKGGTDKPRNDNGKLRLDQLRHWWKIRTGYYAPSPSFIESIMQFPSGWSELRPSETQ